MFWNEKYGSYIYLRRVCRTGARTSTGCVPRAEAGPPMMECENFSSSYCCSWTTFPAPAPLTRHTQHDVYTVLNSLNEEDPSKKVFCGFPCFFATSFYHSVRVRSATTLGIFGAQGMV
jgi:hypothetical protein